MAINLQWIALPVTVCNQKVESIVTKKFESLSCLSCFQDDTAFEKQSALFALAVSDIVLINM